MSDMLRVDVAGRPITVLGDQAVKLIQDQNHTIAIMKLALHRIAQSSVDTTLRDIARNALEECR